MTTFVAIFSGLICHLRRNAHERHAVLVYDPYHMPLLWIRQSDVINCTKAFPEIDPVEPWRRFNIAGETVRIAGMFEDAEATPDDRSTPRVGRFIHDFKPHDAVVRGDKHPNVTAYVRYSGGSFDVASYHEKKARFHGEQNYHCFAKQLRWSRDTDNDVVLTNGQDLEIVVSRSAHIGVTNWDETDATRNGDYKLCAGLGQGNPPLYMETTDGDCRTTGGELPEPRPNLNVECTSSQWP